MNTWVLHLELYHPFRLRCNIMLFLDPRAEEAVAYSLN